MFTTKCYVKIKKMDNRLYVNERLREIGYRRSFESRERNNPYFITRPMYNVGPVFEQTNGYIASFQKLNPEPIDCGTNEALFLALAALRDDSDYMQWFMCRNCGRITWERCEQETNDFGVYYYKATPAELVEHFK